MKNSKLNNSIQKTPENTMFSGVFNTNEGVRPLESRSSGQIKMSKFAKQNKMK